MKKDNQKKAYQLFGFSLLGFETEVRNSRITELSYEIELRKMTSHFELSTRIFLQKFFVRVTNSTS